MNFGWEHEKPFVKDKDATPNPYKDSARFPWQEVTKVAHYRLEINAMTRPMMVREDKTPYKKREQ